MYVYFEVLCLRLMGYGSIRVYVCKCIYTLKCFVKKAFSHALTYTVIERSPPPGGVSYLLFTMFAHQEPCIRGPPPKELYQVLRGGSSYTRFFTREHSK